MPDTYGIAKDPLFCLKKNLDEDDYQRFSLNEEIIDSNPPIFDKNVIISIKNLSKKFGDFDAVKNLTL